MNNEENLKNNNVSPLGVINDGEFLDAKPNAEFNEKKKKNLKVPIIIVAVLFLIVVVIVGYKVLFKKSNLSSKQIFTKGVDIVSEYFSGSIDNINSMLVNGESHKINLEINSQDAELKQINEVLNKLDLLIDTRVDYNNKNYNVNVGLIYNNEEITTAQAVLTEDNIYLGLGTLFNKYISIPNKEYLNDMDIWEIGKTDNYNILVEEFAKAIKDNMKDEYFSEEDADVKIYDKTLKVKKYMMRTISEKEANGNFSEDNFSLNVVNSLTYDEKFVNALINITGKSKEDIISSIESLYEGDDLAFYAEVLVNENDEIVRIAVGPLEQPKDSESLIAFTLEDDHYNIELIDNGDVTNYGTLKIKDNIFELNLEYTDYDENITFKIVLDNGTTKTNNIKFNVTCSDDSDYCTEGSIEINLVETNNLGNIKVRINSGEEEIILTDEYEKGKFTELNINDIKNNSIKYEDLKDTDGDLILENIKNNKALMNLISDLAKFEDLFATSGSSSEYIDINGNAFEYSSNSNIKNDVNITIPTGFIKSYDDDDIDYEYDTDSINSCEFELSEVKDYKSSEEFLNKAYDGLKNLNASNIINKVYNNNSWYVFSYDDVFGRTYLYATTQNNKVYLLKYSIDDDAPAQCNTAKEQVLNSISFK